MGKEDKGKNPMTEATWDIIIAVGKAIIDIIDAKRKRWIILNVKKMKPINGKKEGWISKLDTLLTVSGVILTVIKALGGKRN